MGCGDYTDIEPATRQRLPTIRVYGPTYHIPPATCHILPTTYHLLACHEKLPTAVTLEKLQVFLRHPDLARKGFKVGPLQVDLGETRLARHV